MTWGSWLVFVVCILCATLDFVGLAVGAWACASGWRQNLPSMTELVAPALWLVAAALVLA